jgi:hypothetical protein
MRLSGRDGAPACGQSVSIPSIMLLLITGSRPFTKNGESIRRSSRRVPVANSFGARNLPSALVRKTA